MKRSRKRRRRRMGFFLIFFVVCLAATAGGYIYMKNLAYEHCVVEAGIEVTPQDFLKKTDPESYFTAESDELHVDVPGEYQLYVKSGLFTYPCRLTVQDTIAPAAVLAPKLLQYGETCEAADFVTEIRDATRVTAAYRLEPDYTKTGTQTVAIVFTDLGGNKTVLETELTICPVVAELVVEAGSKMPEGKDFLIQGGEAELLTELKTTEFLGEYPVELLAEGQKYPSLLRIVDTTPPEAEVHGLTGFAMYPRQPEEFVTSVEDVTQVTVTYAKEPDFSFVGSQPVELLFTDEGGNRLLLRTSLTLEADTEPPDVRGAVDLIYMMGGTISYRKNVTVTDNSGLPVDLVIDNSQVNLEQPGKYPLTYSAVDMAGNATVITVEISVYPKTYDIDELYAKADQILGKIFTDGMSDYDKLWAIYKYVLTHVGYITHSEKETWERAAYEGLVKGQGDCYVFACCTKVLLDRAGIRNMDITKIPSKTRHYWNLVDIGEGWRHLDACPRKDHPTIFYWTDAQLMDYSKKHNDSHNYDHSVYPHVD